MKKTYSYRDLTLPLYTYKELLALLALPESRCSDRFWTRESTHKIRNAALEYLMEHHSKKGNPSLAEGHELVVVGQSRFKQANLRERLAKFGIKLKVSVTQQTTHVLLGLNTKSTKGLEKYHCFLIHEQFLQQELDRLEQPYLQQADNEVRLEHLEQLLLSTDEDNVMLAIQLMEGGGFPKEMREATFIALKGVRNNKNRKAIRDLLYKHIDKETQDDISQTYLFHRGMEEHKLERNLRYYTAGRFKGKVYKNMLNADKIAALMYQYHNCCIQYIFAYQEDRSLSVKIIKRYLQQDELNLSGLDIGKLPKELKQFPAITTVKLQDNRFKNIPPALAKLPHLKYLDLSKNRIEILNKTIEKLTNLEYLNIKGRLQANFIKDIQTSNLPNLRELVINEWVYDINQQLLDSQLPRTTISTH